MTDTPELEFTGERFTPECVREIAYEHWHRYAWATRLVGARDVLDAACGEGYGSHLLSTTAARVSGVDLSAEAIAHARERYPSERLDFRVADVLDLPFDDDSFDVVVSFETLEHLSQQDAMLAEFRRVLRSGGVLVLSSPDRRTYSELTGYNNPFHLRELYRHELEALLASHFPAYRLYGQKLMFMSALWQLDRGGQAIFHCDDNGQLSHADRPEPAPLYFLALAAAEPALLPDIEAVSLYGDRAESVYQHYNDEVARHIRAGHLLAERDAEIEALRERIRQLEQAG